MKATAIMTIVMMALSSTFLLEAVVAATVDAGTLTTVTVEAPLYDSSLGEDGGCDPDGCVGALTRDGDSTTLTSRWSCKPELGSSGSTCSITYALAEIETVEALGIAMYKGDERTRTIDIYVDGDMVTTWTSSGTTSNFEMVYLDVAGQAVELRGVLDDSEWLSLLEVEILVNDGAGSVASVEAGTVGTVSASATFYDPDLSIDNGCDPAGCTASLTRDGDLSESSRWSCSPLLGGDCTISYGLGASRELTELRLAMYQGTDRTRTVQVYVDGALITTWTTSGTTDDFESIDLSGISGGVIDVTGVLGDSEWLSIIETEIMVLSDGATSSPVPAPTPAPTPANTNGGPTVQPATTSGADLESVSLIPLAETGSSGNVLERFYIKDGDFSTSWTCTTETADDYTCYINFDMYYYRHIKQVKIALANGADGAFDMRLGGRSNNDIFEEFITSSGTTDEFETYAYDYFTNFVSIRTRFPTGGGTISISEVEIVEEIQPGEISVTDFSNSPEDVISDAFEWRSEDDEVGEDITFRLSTYATLTALELQFPQGETYKFDLWFYSGSDAGNVPFNFEPHTVIEGFESADAEGWQAFDLTEGLDADQYNTALSIIIQGTGSGAAGFHLLNARIFGTSISNPSDTFYVGSTYIENWLSALYPDFVAEGSSDQEAIMAAICAVKQASFDGVDCVGEDSSATGRVMLPMGEFNVNGNIFVKSGVYLDGVFSDDDSPYITEILLEEGAAGATDVDAIIVFDGVSEAGMEDIHVRGLYDTDTGLSTTAVDGLGSTCVSVTDSQDIYFHEPSISFCDGDALLVRDSRDVFVDGGDYDDLLTEWTIGNSRGTGLSVDSSESVSVRRHHFQANGEANIKIVGSTSFTFTAETEGLDIQGDVGNSDELAPVDIVIESSSSVTFDGISIRSATEPVVTVSADSSSVNFDDCSFYSVESGTCVIEMEDPSVVTAIDDELVLEENCYVKV